MNILDWAHLGLGVYVIASLAIIMYQRDTIKELCEQSEKITRAALEALDAAGGE